MNNSDPNKQPHTDVWVVDAETAIAIAQAIAADRPPNAKLKAALDEYKEILADPSKRKDIARPSDTDSNIDHKE